MNIKYSIKVLYFISIFICIINFSCATLRPKEKPKTLIETNRGTVLFLDKYEFQKPPEGWFLMKNLEGGDFEFGFLKFEKGDFPSQTILMYDDAPYGSSRDLRKRVEQYCSRFLFNSGIDLNIKKKDELNINGREAIAIFFDGENPNRGEKVKSKVYLIKKGNRIISFVCTQWRPINGSFTKQPFDYFDNFVYSFKFLKKDFYEELEEEIIKLRK